jgi:hypothetical protein
VPTRHLLVYQSFRASFVVGGQPVRQPPTSYFFCRRTPASFGVR